MAIISTEFWPIGLHIGTILESVKGLLTLNKSISQVKGRLDSFTSLEFTSTDEDTPPLINLALTQLSFTERVDLWFDIGATDIDKDLDAINATSMVTIYLDPAYQVEEGDGTAGVLPPRAVLMRCLAGSGLLYLNTATPFTPDMNKVAPLQLHANAGLFYYTFPRQLAHVASAGEIPRVALNLMSMRLRTFESANRFQVVVFK